MYLTTDSQQTHRRQTAPAAASVSSVRETRSSAPARGKLQYNTVAYVIAMPENQNYRHLPIICSKI